jgi:uncharacterized membrane protein
VRPWFGVISSPGFGAILVLGLVLLAIFLLWLIAANAIYQLTLGPEPPVSITAFVHDVFTTRAGWTMIVVGVGVGFLFALLVLAISVVSFPLLLDRDVGLRTAVLTSIGSVAANPGPMAVLLFPVRRRDNSSRRTCCRLRMGHVPFADLRHFRDS